MLETPEVGVVRSLGRADEEMQAALDAFRRARRMRLYEIFRPAPADPDSAGAEEIHVGHGVSALLEAERHVAAANAGLLAVGAEHPARLPLQRSIERLDTTFRVMFHDLRQRPHPNRIVSQLKRARRAIPHGVVRKYARA